MDAKYESNEPSTVLVRIDVPAVDLRIRYQYEPGLAEVEF